MSLRCDFCRHLKIEELRCIVHPHHNSLLQLKECAQSKACDICALFWACLRMSCHQDSIQDYLDGRQADAPYLRDTRIYLQGCLPDMGLGAGPESTQSAEKATILVSSGEFASSRVHGTVAVYAKPGKSFDSLLHVLHIYTEILHSKHHLSTLTL